jgi:predicted dehydrogenase
MAFRDSVTNDKEPVPNAEDGFRALEMILAAYDSDRTGQRVLFPFRPVAVTQ